jgi:hypothetical protein
LLHTWSLAVEEQYYLLFPLTLMILWRFGRARVFWLIVFVSVVSFGLSEWGWRHAATGNFYLAPSRAWELLAGSICAFLSDGRKQRESNVLSLAGLALIAFSVVYYDRFTPFPSAYTLAPVVGTALIILYASANTWTARLLSLKPIVGIGLISYSAYLWHQPLFAFARLRSLTAPPNWLMVALAALSLVLAYLSWRFVEKPFRRAGSGPLPTRRSIFQAASFAAIALVGIGLVGALQRGMPYRFNSATLVDPYASNDEAGKLTGCVKDFPSTDPEPCIVGKPSPVRIAVLGDSHATQWLPAVVQLSQSKGWQFEVFTKVACPAASLDFAEGTLRRQYYECSQWRSEVLSRITRGKFDAVIISNATFGYTKKNHIDVISPARWRAGLSSTFEQLAKAGEPILYIIDNPHFPNDPVQCTQLALHLGYDPEQTCTVASQPMWDPEARDAELAAVRQDKAARSLNVDRYFCTRGSCSPYRMGRLLMRDDNHITPVAAQEMSDDIGQALEGLMRPRQASSELAYLPAARGANSSVHARKQSRPLVER